jgi:hypothetical protein
MHGPAGSRAGPKSLASTLSQLYGVVIETGALVRLFHPEQTGGWINRSAPKNGPTGTFRGFATLH